MDGVDFNPTKALQRQLVREAKRIYPDHETFKSKVVGA
jgi:Rad3-related DNA helicase